MDTKYAPPERIYQDQLSVERKKIESVDQISEVLNALPYVAAILNEQRQIIFSNNVLLDSSGNTTIDQILGKRPGEVFNCVYSKNETGGCGTTENCRVCGAVNAVLESQKTGKKVTMESRITSVIDNEIIAYDYQVTSTPFYWNKNRYTILSLSDISHEKRRRALERIFFHDIINKAGSLSGFLDLLKDIKDTAQIREYLTLAGKLSDEITEEILSQRALLEAESGDLLVDIKPAFSLDILKDTVNQMMYHLVAKNKFIIVNNNSVDISFNIDIILLNRVIINMLKNALEATNEGGRVEVGCNLEKEKLIYWVHNDSVMSEKVKMQIFQRSFSTKGPSRGLGTYSIRLLSEKYLKGKVYFRSEKDFGTRFFLELNLQ